MHIKKSKDYGRDSVKSPHFIFIALQANSAKPTWMQIDWALKALFRFPPSLMNAIFSNILATESSVLEFPIEIHGKVKGYKKQSWGEQHMRRRTTEISRRNLFFSASTLMIPPWLCCLWKSWAMSLCSLSSAGVKLKSGCRVCSTGGGYSPSASSDSAIGRRHTGHTTCSTQWRSEFCKVVQHIWDMLKYHSSQGKNCIF